MAKQSHDIGLRKRLASHREGRRAAPKDSRRMRRRQRRDLEWSAFVERWSA